MPLFLTYLSKYSVMSEAQEDNLYFHAVFGSRGGKMSEAGLHMPLN